MSTIFKVNEKAKAIKGTQFDESVYQYAEDFDPGIGLKVEADMMGKRPHWVPFGPIKIVAFVDGQRYSRTAPSLKSLNAFLIHCFSADDEELDSMLSEIEGSKEAWFTHFCLTEQQLAPFGFESDAGHGT